MKSTVLADPSIPIETYVLFKLTYDYSLRYVINNMLNIALFEVIKFQRKRNINAETFLQ